MTQDLFLYTRRVNAMAKKKGKKYYHATYERALDRISREGLKPGGDGVVYLCEKPEDTVGFLSLRGATRVSVIEINASSLDPEKIEEGLDHNPAFFGNVPVKAYRGRIPPKAFLFNDKQVFLTFYGMNGPTDYEVSCPECGEVFIAHNCHEPDILKISSPEYREWYFRINYNHTHKKEA
jgi:hypothetical protein